MIDLNQKITFIQKMHLFGGLVDEQVVTIAISMEEKLCQSGDVILVEGEISDKFYLIYKGSVKVRGATKSGSRGELATLISGDHFGEMSLNLREPSTISVIVEKETHLLVLSTNDLLNFVNQFPQFKTNLKIAISSNLLARELDFTWLFPNEIVYYVARKHKVLLWIRLSILLVVISAIFLLIAFLGLPSFLLIGLALVTAVLLPWFYIDWMNDYYVVTNQRIIWLEKLVGVFDRRKEVPMSAILSVDFDTTFWGRMIDIGAVVMRTFTGQISLSYLEHYEEVSGQISDQWKRIQEQEQSIEKGEMKKIVREKLFGGEKKPVPDFIQTTEPFLLKKESFLTRNFSHFLKQRFEEDGIITYRRFWVYLVFQSWKPLLVMVFLFGYLSFLVTNLRGQISTMVIVCAIALFLSLLRLIYIYLDWSNDFFQITSEQVIDVDRTPFGSDQRRSAPLENILSVEFDMKGLVRIIFNYGTVNINIGSTILTFNEVKNPAIVQQEILQKMNTRVTEIRKQEAEFPQEQLSDWLAIYHNIANEDEQKNILGTEKDTL